MLVTKSLMSREDSSSEEASLKMSRATNRIFMLDVDVDRLLSVNDGSEESVTCKLGALPFIQDHKTASC